MFVLDMSVEKWVGNKNEGELIENPSWNHIETAIRELNGKSKTLVTLGADGETYMSIGGGESEKYIITVTFDNLSFYSLVDSSKPNITEKLVVGGQEGIYLAKMCVDLLRCLLASRTFTELGKLDPLLSWEEDKSLAVA
ncbi:hypothetical protein [Scytonema sp. NUACC26]|uniref:hypothetical protein n=1 Tax=Scytonema sp. NUACC26 TaxID=3140176 RepID=UPI0034DB84B2